MLAGESPATDLIIAAAATMVADWLTDLTDGRTHTAIELLLDRDNEQIAPHWWLFMADTQQKVVGDFLTCCE